MDRTELQALIDRVIGTKGIMRSSAWWVRKLFNKVLEYVDSSIKSVKIKSDTEMSDESENTVQNKVIKAYVDDAISKKADTSYVNDAVSKKADIGELHTELNRLTDIILENEAVVARALNDLNNRLKALENETSTNIL